MWELTLPVLLAGMAAALGGGFIDAIAGGTITYMLLVQVVFA